METISALPTFAISNAVTLMRRHYIATVEINKLFVSKDVDGLLDIFQTDWLFCDQNNML